MQQMQRNGIEDALRQLVLKKNAEIQANRARCDSLERKQMSSIMFYGMIMLVAGLFARFALH